MGLVDKQLKYVDRVEKKSHLTIQTVLKHPVTLTPVGLHTHTHTYIYIYNIYILLPPPL